MIHLSSDSSALFAGPAPPLVRDRGFIVIHDVPRGHGHARGGGHGDDALSYFGNGYVTSKNFR